MKPAFCLHLLLMVAAAHTFSPTDPVQLGAAPPTSPDGDRPWFEPDPAENVTVLLGRTAYLTCRVRALGNRTISWVRMRDVHLLTVGENTYTSDERFRARPVPASSDWNLQVKFVQHRDAGLYACQVSTSPPVSYLVHLTVVEPVTEILGGPELFIDTESTINLTCVVRRSPEPPAFIFWKHNDQVISYDSTRGGVSVVTIKGAVTASYLLIQRARPSDSGRYSCQPSGASQQSLRVHVLQGEKPAAMQTSSCPSRPGRIGALLIVILQQLARGWIA